MVNTLAHTDVGRDLLTQDYLLKQITSTLLYPENEMGRKFWNKLYAKAYQELGITDIPMDTLHKVWIVPDKSDVYRNGNTIFIANAKLKVLMEEDFMSSDQGSVTSLPAGQAGDQKQKDLSTDVMKEIILPVIEQEVNEGTHFAPLRQIFHSLILAKWFKQELHNSFLGQVYMDKGKINGVDIADKQVKSKVYERYLEAYKQGVYNYIKEEFDANTQETIPRKYFSGGADWAMTVNTLPGITLWKATGDPTVLSYQLETAPVDPDDQALVANFDKEGVVNIIAGVANLPLGQISNELNAISPRNLIPLPGDEGISLSDRGLNVTITRPSHSTIRVKSGNIAWRFDGETIIVENMRGFYRLMDRLYKDGREHTYISALHSMLPKTVGAVSLAYDLRFKKVDNAGNFQMSRINGRNSVQFRMTPAFAAQGDGALIAAPAKENVARLIAQAAGLNISTVLNDLNNVRVERLLPREPEETLDLSYRGIGATITRDAPGVFRIEGRRGERTLETDAVIHNADEFYGLMDRVLNATTFLVASTGTLHHPSFYLPQTVGEETEEFNVRFTRLNYEGLFEASRLDGSNPIQFVLSPAFAAQGDRAMQVIVPTTVSNAQGPVDASQIIHPGLKGYDAIIAQDGARVYSMHVGGIPIITPDIAGPNFVKEPWDSRLPINLSYRGRSADLSTSPFIRRFPDPATGEYGLHGFGPLAKWNLMQSNRAQQLVMYGYSTDENDTRAGLVNDVFGPRQVRAGIRFGDDGTVYFPMDVHNLDDKVNPFSGGRHTTINLKWEDRGDITSASVRGDWEVFVPATHYWPTDENRVGLPDGPQPVSVSKLGHHFLDWVDLGDPSVNEDGIEIAFTNLVPDKNGNVNIHLRNKKTGQTFVFIQPHTMQHGVLWVPGRKVFEANPNLEHAFSWQALIAPPTAVDLLNQGFTADQLGLAELEPGETRSWEPSLKYSKESLELPQLATLITNQDSFHSVIGQVESALDYTINEPVEQRFGDGVVAYFPTWTHDNNNWTGAAKIFPVDVAKGEYIIGLGYEKNNPHKVFLHPALIAERDAAMLADKAIAEGEFERRMFDSWQPDQLFGFIDKALLNALEARIKGYKSRGAARRVINRVFKAAIPEDDLEEVSRRIPTGDNSPEAIAEMAKYMRKASMESIRANDRRNAVYPLYEIVTGDKAMTATKATLNDRQDFNALLAQVLLIPVNMVEASFSAPVATYFPPETGQTFSASGVEFRKVDDEGLYEVSQIGGDNPLQFSFSPDFSDTAMETEIVELKSQREFHDLLEQVAAGAVERNSIQINYGDHPMEYFHITPGRSDINGVFKFTTVADGLFEASLADGKNARRFSLSREFSIANDSEHQAGDVIIRGAGDLQKFALEFFPNADRVGADLAENPDVINYLPKNYWGGADTWDRTRYLGNIEMEYLDDGRFQMKLDGQTSPVFVLSDQLAPRFYLSEASPQQDGAFIDRHRQQRAEQDQAMEAATGGVHLGDNTFINIIDQTPEGAPVFDAAQLTTFEADFNGFIPVPVSFPVPADLLKLSGQKDGNTHKPIANDGNIEPIALLPERRKFSLRASDL